ncbi:MAG TPA: DUF4132 domain-containing protein [Pseudonocardia sp.]|nr:DUF4132 domain-containing protein [Pseudonocardia sp.]
MTATTTVSGGVDEETFTLSPGLARLALPRRDQGRPRPRPTAGADAELAGLLGRREQELRAVLTHASTDPGIAAAARAHLAGAADPLGAAAVATALHSECGNESLALFPAGWVAAHGPVFAAEAAAQLGAVAEAGRYESGLHLVPGPPLVGQWNWFGEQILARVRSVLAAAGDADHAAAVAALGRLRTTPVQRAIIAYLVPTETAWVAEACAEAGTAPHGDHALLLLCAASSPAHVADLLPVTSGWELTRSAQVLPTLVRSVGPAIAPALATWFDGDGSDLDRRLATVLAQLPTDEAFGLLLERLGHKHVRSAVLEAMGRYPARALRLLAAAAADGSGGAATLLAGHLAAHPELAGSLVPGLPEAACAAAEAAAQATARSIPEAPAELLPAVLTSPPWARPRRRVRPVVLTGLTPPRTEMAWEPGEREEWARHARPRSGLAALDDDAWASWARRFREGRTSFWEEKDYLLAAPDAVALPLLQAWTPSETWNAEEWGRALLARFGLAALPALLGVVAANPTAASIPLLGPVRDARVAVTMAELMARLKAGRAPAMAWFTRHGEAAVPLLVPAALGEPGRTRTAAEDALRFLATRHGAEAVVAAAGPHGPEAAEAVSALLARDPLEALPARLPTVAAWADPAQLPQVWLRDGAHALPAEATRHLLTMLALSRPGEPYAGVAQVAEVCEPRSLAEFGWALFTRWQAAELPAKDSWVLTALGLLGDDDTVRRLAPIVRAWPGEGGHQRAVAGLDTLAEIGSDVALMHLDRIARRAPFSGLRKRAREKIDRIAAERGLSAEQLADRLVPDLGLDPGGSLLLDYGPRRFRVGFDEQLKPYVADADGRRRRDLPKPGAKDDPELAPAAHRRFAELKKDARAIASDQIHRLEKAMVAQRRWSAAEFTELFVAHPLVWHIARRLVWACYDGSGAVTASFRIAEDRTLADVDDTAVTLPADAVVGVAHPLHLGESLPRWAELLADYEILQPFPQLGRPVARFTDEERAARHLPRFEGAVVGVGAVLGLQGRGWNRGEPQDAGVEPWIVKPLPDGRAVVLHLDPGIVVGDVSMLDEQKVEGICIERSERGHHGYAHDQGDRFGTLDAVSESELLADLTELVSR